MTWDQVKQKPLHLNLKRKWFDMIASGEKMEEFRRLNPRWLIRFRRELEGEYEGLPVSYYMGQGA